MNVDVFTIRTPKRCPASERLHRAFICDAVALRNDLGALARLKVAAREKDKALIIHAQQGNHSIH